MVRWSDFGSDAAFHYNAIALAILEDVILCTDTKATHTLAYLIGHDQQIWNATDEI